MHGHHSSWNFVAITYTTEDTSIIYVLPVHGRHFDFRLGFMSSVIFLIGGISAIFKNIILITVLLNSANYHWSSFTLVDYDDMFFIQEFI